MFHYLMNVIVFQFKVTSLEYFLDVMTEWEINDIIENLPYLDRNMWESQRLLALIDASKFSKKKLELKDICKFKWEEDYSNEEHITKMTDEDINRLKQIAKQWEKE